MPQSLTDTLLERTIIPSFSRLGYKIRTRTHQWKRLQDYSLSGKIVVLTGGTSGIGEAAARLYAQSGATLVIVGRDVHKTEQLIAELQSKTGNRHIHSAIADLGSQHDVRALAQSLAERFPVIDVLVHNAGALFNTRKRAENGTDLSVELMVVTPFLLTALLLPQLQAGSPAMRPSSEPYSDPYGETYRLPGRVLTMSSGGMYTQPLTVDGLEMDDANYHGAKQYALAKRAQVVLNEMWAERVDPHDTVFHALHPGWVETPGITEALPGFSKILGPLGLLRTPDEGADTLVWLSASSSPEITQRSGAFWHDREIRSIDMTQKTRRADNAVRRLELWQWCEQHVGLKVPVAGSSVERGQGEGVSVAT